MTSPRSALILLLASFLLYVQTSAALHAVVHPFHVDEHQEDMACHIFSAGERLTKYASLYTPPTIPLAPFTLIRYRTSVTFLVTFQKIRPHARSPPFVFS